MFLNSNAKIIKLLILIFCICIFVKIPIFAYASDFRTIYDVHYYPNLDKSTLNTRVSFKIQITNLKPDMYIKTFSLIFPKSFQIGNIKVSDDNGTIKEDISQSGQNQTIKMEFSNPLSGLNITNSLYLDFLQTNLFKPNGRVWEVMIPILENRGEGEYTVTVHMPVSENKKISIAKPKPERITGDQIIWKNPTTKTIYAVFGSRQVYDTTLRYHLENPNIARVYTDIAFPPDTLYQQIFVKSIVPIPDKVFTDEDGNYIGRYYLNPKEIKDIIFRSEIQIFSQLRSDVQTEIGQSFQSQKRYLLTPDKNWTLPQDYSTTKFKSIQEIYSYVTSHLSYNYGRLNSKVTRMGAAEALKYPDQAVCTEFSDLFVALAKENGFYARELQGYGFSNEQELRPLSFKSDVLHSWTEYFDENTRIWMSIDPTWEKTSGIDYFTSLDLNHIVFVIHGKNSELPYPAGSYKLNENSKDINITPVDTVPQEIHQLNIEQLNQPIAINSKNLYQIKLSIQNVGNIYERSFKLNFKAKGLILKSNEITISKLAPYEKKEIILDYELENKWKSLDTKLVVSTGLSEEKVIPIRIDPLLFTLIKNVVVICGIIILIYIIIRLIFG